MKAATRFDADFAAHPLYDFLIELQNKKTFLPLEAVLDSIGSGHTPYLHDVSTGDVGFVTVECIGNLSLQEECLKKITKEHFESEFSKRQVKQGDVLCTIKRRICMAYPFLKEPSEPLTINQDVALLTPKKTISSAYLASYLCGKIGQGFADLVKTEQMNPYISLVSLRQLPVPQLDKTFYANIDDVLLRAYNLIADSQATYAAAEDILLAEVGLKDFAPSQDPVNVKTFAESFATSGRLDAEYYQKKYEDVVARIVSQPYDTLDELVTITKSIEPGSAHYVEDGLPFLRVADYSKHGTTEPQKYLSTDFIKENTKLIEKLKPKKGTILFSKDGSVGTAYHLREDMNCITSGAVLHLKVRDETHIISEYLTLALNSKLVQMQAERDAGGSIILHWRVSEIEKVVVPVIPYPKQQEIAALIEQSFALKAQSEHLLEVAKRAVEFAIEVDEAAALRYIESATEYSTHD